MDNNLNELVVEQNTVKLDELKTMLENTDGFLIGLTTLKDGKLNHYLLSNKFPMLDILPSILRVRELAIKRVENGV